MKEFKVSIERAEQLSTLMAKHHSEKCISLMSDVETGMLIFTAPTWTYWDANACQKLGLGYILYPSDIEPARIEAHIYQFN